MTKKPNIATFRNTIPQIPISTTPGAFLVGSIGSDSAEKVVVSESSTTLPYGRAATNINDLRNLVAAFARTWGFFSGIGYET